VKKRDDFIPTFPKEQSLIRLYKKSTGYLNSDIGVRNRQFGKVSREKRLTKLLDVVGGVAEQLSRAGEVDEKMAAIS